MTKSGKVNRALIRQVNLELDRTNLKGKPSAPECKNSADECRFCGEMLVTWLEFNVLWLKDTRLSRFGLS